MPWKSSIANLKIGPKLIAAFLVIGIVPFAIIGVVALMQSNDALHRQAFNQLESVRGIKKAQIEQFFGERRGDMGVLMETVGTMRRQALSKLTAVRESKKAAIERYFTSIRNQVLTMSENRMVVTAMRDMREAFHAYRGETANTPERLTEMRAALRTYYDGEFSGEYMNQNGGATIDMAAAFDGLDDDAVVFQYNFIRANQHPLGSKHLLDKTGDGTMYDHLHAEIHPVVRSYLEKFGYYDIFLVDAETGDIVYSVFKELDFGTSLWDGPWAETNFGQVFRMALESEGAGVASLVDYDLYTPSYDAPAGFIATPIYDAGEKIGVLIFQMPLDRISEIMGERAGLGETGEAVLVGSDYRMRSDSHLDKQHRSVVASFKDPKNGRIRTAAVRAAIEGGKSGVDFEIDYRGKPTVVAYAPVDIGGVTWGINAKIDIAEAFVPVNAEGKEYYADYIEQYGYYDLFLIDPTGYVFYSVTHEADYQTNMVDGKYASSGLGKLTRAVLKSGDFGLVDFEPYPPSNNEPASFIGQPVVNNGKTELVVALQLPLDAINAVMQRREGMGETGETYLVGQDLLMRSDSYLDQVNHTVEASFADPAKGSVDTDASRRAL
ncbi:MAG: cache domain-containing protein, partial [Alphaproteobacteria bacterium]|nr:cache domain-containing protein [Alphaproteobacteria bacterium]